MKKRDIFGSIQRQDISKDVFDDLNSPYNQQIKFLSSLVKWSYHATSVIKDSGYYEGRLVTYADHITIGEPSDKLCLTWFNGGIDDGLPVDIRAALEVLDAIHEVYLSAWNEDRLKLANASIWLGTTIANAHFAKELGESGSSKGKGRIDKYEALFNEYKVYYFGHVDQSLSNDKAADELLKYSLEVERSTLKKEWIPKFKRGEKYKQ